MFTIIIDMVHYGLEFFGKANLDCEFLGRRKTMNAAPFQSRDRNTNQEKYL